MAVVAAVVGGWSGGTVEVRAVVINEIRSDQSGTDFSEYFELFGAPGESLDGLTYLVLGDPGSGTIEVALDLSGGLIPEGRLYLVAESSFENLAGQAFEGTVPDRLASLNFENDDNVTHLLVSGFTGANNDDLDTNDDGRLDVTPWDALVDGVALIEEPNPPAGTEFEYGTDLGLQVVGPNIVGENEFVPGHVYRSPNGGLFLIGGFDVGTNDSPRADNPGTMVLIGDMDGDNDVDFDDIDDFVLGLNNPGAYESQHGVPPALRGSTDMDADLDFDDIPGFVAILSGGTSSRAVPEPSTLSLFCVAGLLTLARRPRARAGGTSMGS
jgi:hypothetical protein